MNRLTKAQKAELKEALDGFIEELEQRFRPDATEEELEKHIKDYFYYFTGDFRQVEALVGEYVMEEHFGLDAENPLNNQDCLFVHNAIVKALWEFADNLDAKKMVAEYMKGEFESAFPKGGL